MNNIVENNKLIAEFMGWKENKDMEVKLTSGGITYYFQKNDEACIPETMCYHSDWNWLMKVVEKIHSMQSYGVIINPNGTYIQDEDDKLICITFKNEEVNGEIISSSNIEATFNCCAEFVKWYNEQNNWKKERMYSEDDMIMFADFFHNYKELLKKEKWEILEMSKEDIFKKWIEKVKKK